MKTASPLLGSETRKMIKEIARREAGYCAVAPAGADQPIPFSLTIGEDKIDFEFGARANFRMGTVDKPFELTDCSDPKRAHAATVTWLWACLSRHEAEAFPEPEDLAEMIPLDRMLDCTKAFIKAIADYNTARKAARKAEAAESAKTEAAAKA